MNLAAKQVIICAVVCSTLVGVAPQDDCSYSAVTAFLHNITSYFPQISRLYSIGQTQNDKELWAVVITDAPEERPLLRPQVKLVGNVNGKSESTCGVLLKLISHLLLSYESGSSLERNLIETVEIHILPNLDPDRSSRNKVHINRDFPNIFGGDHILPPKHSETFAVIRWIHENNFVLSASLITGMYVICVPFDSIPAIDHATVTHEEHLTPDNDIFTHLASSYWNHTTPRPTADEWQCPPAHKLFPNGIVNGAAWYTSTGTMMDYNYFFGVFELTVGLACTQSDPDNLWFHHKHALLQFISQANSGVKGQVVDQLTGQHIPTPIITTLYKTFPKPWPTTLNGEFWRPLPPGLYAINVSAPGYISTIAPFEVRKGREHATELQIALHPNLPSVTEVTTSNGTNDAFYFTSTKYYPQMEHSSDSSTIAQFTPTDKTPQGDKTFPEARQFHRVLHGMLIQLASSSIKHCEPSILILISCYLANLIY